MTTVTIAKIGSNQTINYAVDELARCLKRIDPTVRIDRRVYDKYDPSLTNLLWVGRCELCEYSKLDDEILIDVKDGAGIITGANDRAVLIAVYRLLKELGCCWIRPGDDGEIFPNKKLTRESINIALHEMPSTRYRTICIEGASGVEHVCDMVSWLPKIGMNCYYMQFLTPHAFFKMWYSKQGHPNPPDVTVTPEEAHRMKAAIDEEIIKRGLIYMCMGHGATIYPFGIDDFTLDDPNSPMISEKMKSYFALVDGERKLNRRIAHTQLCYSNPEVRETMAQFVLDYLTENPHVELFATGIADGMNNWCECEECKKLRPADWMVMIINEIDEKLTAAGIDTKITFSCYLDTAWPPIREKIKNPSRFLINLCPNGRSYRKALYETDRDPNTIEPKPFVYNNIDVPREPEDVLALYYEWRKREPECECYLTEYHLMWEHYFDPGYNYTARVIHKDVTGLKKNNFTGFKMYLEQRQAFPTAFPAYAMAQGLWDSDSKFEDVADEYYTAAFGKDAKAVYEYFDKLEELFDSEFLRYEHPEAYATVDERYDAAVELIKEFRKSVIEPRKDEDNTWRYLWIHSEFVERFAKLIKIHDQPDVELQDKVRAEFVDWIWSIEDDIHRVFDHFEFLDRVMFRLRRLFSLKPDKEVNF